MLVAGCIETTAHMNTNGLIQTGGLGMSRTSTALLDHRDHLFPANFCNLINNSRHWIFDTPIFWRILSGSSPAR